MTDIGYHIASIAARRLPVWMTDHMAVWLADLYASAHPARARDEDRRVERIWRAAGLVGPPPGARETFRAFAWALRDFLGARGSGPRAPRVRLDKETARHLAEARASSVPTIVVSGHFGPWEMALWWLAKVVGPIDAIAAPHRLHAVERFFRARRAAFGVRTLSGSRPAAEAIERLRSGGWIAALADRAWRGNGSAHARPAGGSGGHAVRRESTPAGLVTIEPAPLLIARRARAQVLAGVAWREPDGAIAVRLHAPFTLRPSRGGLKLSQATEALQRFFDEHVRAHPTQWFNWSGWATRDPAR